MKIIMKKILAVAMATMLSMQSIVCIAADDNGKVDVRPVNADGRMVVNVTFPEEYARKEIFVYVLNPGMTIDEIVDLSMKDTMEVFQYHGQKEYVADGINFEFNMNESYVNSEIDPVYNVYAATEDGDVLNCYFTFYDEGEKQGVLASVNNKNVTASDAEDILIKYSLQYLQKLYEKGKVSDIADKLNKLSDGTVDKEDVEGLFVKALLLATAQSGNLPANDIKAYNDNIGVEPEILNEIDNLTDKGINIVNSDMKVNVSDMDSLKKAAEKAILTAAIYGNKNEGNSVLDEVISAHKEFFTDNGLDWEQYKDLNKNTAGKTILKGSHYSFDELIDVLNEMKTTSSGGTSSSGGGGGGSSSGSKGRFSGAPVVTPGVTTPDKVVGFTDLDTVEWARESIERLYKQEVISGKANGIFAPNDLVTREEFVKMICGAFDIKAGDTKISFSDVNLDRWSYEYINIAATADIVKGDGDTFRPADCITREDMAAILVRVLKNKNTYPPIAEYNMPFGDVDMISAYAKESVNILYQHGIVNGKGNNMFAPKDFATRAEAAKMICGVLDIM